MKRENHKTAATYFELKEEWDECGCFSWNGLTFKKGVNDSTAQQVLDKLFEPMKIKPVEISPEVNALRPFILPAKGFTMNEVMTLIQKTFNNRKNK